MTNYFQRLVLTLLCVLITTSCQSKTKNPSVSEEKTSPPPSHSQPSDSHLPGSGPLSLTASFEGLETPHHYEVQLHWFVENREPSIFFIVKRSDWNDGRIVQGDQGFYCDKDVQEGKTYSYQVQMLNAPAGPTTDFTQIEIPKDRVFERGEAVLQGEVKVYHRLFFKRGAKLFWQGGLLEIKAGEIISEDGVLESFSSELKKAAIGEPGKDGGVLTIKADKIRGNLYVRGDGQQGGQGLMGALGDKGQKGARGADTFLYWGNPSAFPLNAYNYRGYWFYCDPPRVPGGTGGVGQMGFSGEAGKPGGNSARVSIDIKNADEGSVLLTHQPGDGGLGGEGGLGGPGGDGGDPGTIDWQTHASKMPAPEEAPFAQFQNCQAVKGALGPQGQKGPEGLRGPKGFEAPFCLRLGDAHQGLCR